MSDYILAPGARLEIGPHGKPYESLGACCAGCAGGGTCGATSSLGALTFTAWGVQIPTVAVLGAAGLAAWWLFFRKKHRRNPARRRRRSRRMFRSRKRRTRRTRR